MKILYALPLSALRSSNFHQIPIHCSQIGKEKESESIRLILISDTVLNKGHRPKQGRQLL